MKYDRVWEVVTHHTPFRKNIWIQLWVKIYNNYRKINCEYIESQNNTKLGMTLRRKSAEFCTHELHHTAVKVTKRKYFVLDAHFIGFSTFFVSAWMHTWKSLTGPLVCTFINTKPGPDLATADGERTSKFSHELHDNYCSGNVTECRYFTLGAHFVSFETFCKKGTRYDLLGIKGAKVKSVSF